MTDEIHLISGAVGSRTISVDAVAEVARHHSALVMVAVDDAGEAAVLREVSGYLPGMIRERMAARRERRIEGMLDSLLDVDPFDPAEARIDAMNAALRADFLREFEVLDSAVVHDRAGHRGANRAQTANAWKARGRILGLPLRGRVVFPAFQFDADGQPLPVLAEVLRALPADLSPWQRAIWLVGPENQLDGRRPIDLVQAGNAAVVGAAANAGRLPIG